MALSSSLNAGVMGLAVNATKLATISDNIANSETHGYKRVDTEFTNLVLQQGAGSYTAGGVRVTTFKDVAAQGAPLSTNNSTDISVAGRGMLPVTNSSGINTQGGDRPLFFATTGSFAPDQNGYLRTQSGSFLLGWPANADGSVNVPGRNSASGLEPVQIAANQLVASPTTRVELGVNVPAGATEAGSTGTPFDLPVEYFDSLGASQTLSLSFEPNVPAAGRSNSWTVTVTDQAGNPPGQIATFDVSFSNAADTAGAIETVTPGAGAAWDLDAGSITVMTANGEISLEIGQPGSGGPLTQFSSNFSPLGVRTDGAPIGNLSSVEIDDGGYVQAIFDNGFRRTIYQVPLADVPNINGLTAQDNQTFGVSQSSGDFFLWDAGTGPVGTTVGFTLIGSTTDVAAELTDLIQTQRAYSSNAKIIQTVDEMLQETTNLIR